jgi:manganese transport protein
VGGAFASIIFGVALLASGQSSTFAGTIAGQILMEGLLQLQMPCWKRRVITRGLALVPAFGGPSCWRSYDDPNGHPFSCSNSSSGRGLRHFSSTNIGAG